MALITRSTIDHAGLDGAEEMSCRPGDARRPSASIPGLDSSPADDRAPPRGTICAHRPPRDPVAWRRGRAVFPAVLIAAGVVFSLLVARETRPGAFYSGDGGVKFLLVRQFAEGDLDSDIRLPAPAWVETLWKRGLYPYEPPFVYSLGERHVAQYSVLFPLLSAPWYRVFGFEGLYVLPQLALWATWFSIAWAARRLALAPWATSLALIACVFASPLTLHGSMFWEHTIGVALAFAGLVATLLGRDEHRARVAFVGGALAGMSVWFRSEHVALVSVALLVFAVAAARRAIPGRTIAGFAGGIAATAAALLLVNDAVYGSPVGVHALAILDARSLPERLRDAATNLADLAQLLVAYFPFVVVALGGAVAALVRSQATRRAELATIVAISLLYLVALPLILPRPELSGAGGKQWGPRYLLILIPLASLAAAQAASAFWARSGRLLRAVSVAALSASLALGVYVNSIAGPRALAADYALRVHPALERVVADPSPILVVTDPYIAQELAAVASDKPMFLTHDWAQFAEVASQALDHGAARFLLLTMRPGLTSGVVRGAGREGELVLTIARAGSYGSYAVHEVSVSRPGSEMSGGGGAVP